MKILAYFFIGYIITIGTFVLWGVLDDNVNQWFCLFAAIVCYITAGLIYYFLNTKPK